MRMTAEMLRELGSCGDYTNRFTRLFPSTDERYVDGVEVTAEVCAANATDFDWSWAVEVMLTAEAQARFNEMCAHDDETLVKLRAEEAESRKRYDDDVVTWREKHGEEYNSPDWNTSQVAREEHAELERRFYARNEEIQGRRNAHRATAFGTLFEDADNRSQRVVDAFNRAEQVRDAQLRDQLVRVERKILELEGEVEHWTTEPAKKIKYWTEEPVKKLAELRAQLTAKRAKIAPLQTKITRRAAIDAQERLIEATAAVERAQADATKAQIALEELTRQAEEAEEAAEAAAEVAEPTAAETAKA